ncbi:hypothetical protein ACOSQ4_022275 [Xanthoceras sorbifolium]
MKFTLYEDKYGMEYSSTRAVKAPRKPPPTPIGSKKFKTQHVDTNSTSKAEGEMKLTAVRIDERKPPETPISSEFNKLMLSLQTLFQTRKEKGKFTVYFSLFLYVVICNTSV